MHGCFLPLFSDICLGGGGMGDWETHLICVSKNVRLFYQGMIGVGGLPFLTCNKKNPRNLNFKDVFLP